MMNSFSESSSQNKAATFVDYDNLYTILNDQSGGEDRPEAFAREILSEVRRYLSEGDNTPTILGRAYADFGSLPTTNAASIQEALHRSGVEPVVTPTGFQGNTSELQLCLDVMDLLNSGTPARTIVIVTGNRPYLPLVRRLREYGRRALVAAVNPPVTDAATQYEEDDVYLDARNLLSQPFAIRCSTMRRPTSSRAPFEAMRPKMAVHRRPRSDRSTTRCCGAPSKSQRSTSASTKRST